MDELSLPFEGKQLTVFASAKIWTCKEKLEFWKTCTHHCELDSFCAFIGFSYEMGGDINERDLKKNCLMNCVGIWKVGIT